MQTPKTTEQNLEEVKRIAWLSIVLSLVFGSALAITLIVLNHIFDDREISVPATTQCTK